VIPLWLWTAVVAAVLAVAVVVGRKDRVHCYRCGKQLPKRTQLVERYVDDTQAELCLSCFLDTFR
jgi:Flp pilus assembly protein TadB